MEVMELMTSGGDGIESDHHGWFRVSPLHDRCVRADRDDHTSKYAGHDVSCCEQAAQTMKAGASE
jgi:hypothetical protein